MSDSLSERGQALEGAFFQQKDRELLQRLREECAAEDKRVALSRSSGITDDRYCSGWWSWKSNRLRLRRLPCCR